MAVHVSRASAGGRCRPPSRAAFTLVELLVVIGLIGLLTGALFPALAATQGAARSTVCLSNIRQAAVAVAMYAAEGGRGLPPPNVSTPSPGLYWCDDDRVGRFLSRPLQNTSANVLTCPADEDGGRSYAMNVWASGKVDGYVLTASPARGTLWRGGGPDAARLILLTEAWSTLRPSGSRWLAEPIVGYAGVTPGQRFGAAGGVAVNAKRWGVARTELPFYRHRTATTAASVLSPVGRVAIAYADGHAAMRSNADLADPVTGVSTLDSLWSPLDAAINK
ncbi:MAG: hypothetical protein JWO31_1705 [Phycisphaerales bacterium]|nr:hypothetical protein [Phycisphaerales bacterium]